MEDIITVTDGRGRPIEIQPMTPGAWLKMLRAAGENSTNQGYLFYASAIFAVRKIDGVPVIRPANDKQMDELADRLGDDGVAAVHKALYPKQSEPVDAAKN